MRGRLRTDYDSEKLYIHLSEMGAKSGVLCRRFLAPFAPTLDRGLIKRASGAEAQNAFDQLLEHFHLELITALASPMDV
jgi:hypothetical protein